MLLTELREAIESGKTAKLFVPKTYEYGINCTLRVARSGSQFLWQRGKIDEPQIGLNLPAKTTPFETWEKLIEALEGGMFLRDTTWEASDEPIENEPKIIDSSEPQLIVSEQEAN